MRQIKEWALLNGGAPAVVLVGVALLAASALIGLIVIGVGIIWFVSWLDPVRRGLIRFLEFPDQGRATPGGEASPRGVSGQGVTYVTNVFEKESNPTFQQVPGAEEGPAEESL